MIQWKTKFHQIKFRTQRAQSHSRKVRFAHKVRTKQNADRAHRSCAAAASGRTKRARTAAQSLRTMAVAVACRATAAGAAEGTASGTAGGTTGGRGLLQESVAGACYRTQLQKASARGCCKRLLQGCRRLLQEVAAGFCCWILLQETAALQESVPGACCWRQPGPKVCSVPNASGEHLCLGHICV